MKSNPSSNFSDAAFIPLPLAPMVIGGADWRKFRSTRRSQAVARKRKVVWSTAPVQHPVTAEMNRCPTPVFLQDNPHPTYTNLNSRDGERSGKTALKSPLAILPTIRRTKTPDISKFYRFSRFPPYMQYTVERGKSQSPRTPRTPFVAKRAQTPQDTTNIHAKRPHSIFLELKNRITEPESSVHHQELGIFNYKQADIRSLRAIKQELRFLQKLREETYDKAVDDVLDEYQLNSIMDEELTFMNKKGNVFAKYLDGQAPEPDYFKNVQYLP